MVRYTKPNRYDGRRPVDDRWPFWSIIWPNLVIGLAMILTGIAMGIGQSWTIPVIWIGCLVVVPILILRKRLRARDPGRGRSTPDLTSH